jgi:hypothetical protein
MTAGTRDHLSPGADDAHAAHRSSLYLRSLPELLATFAPFMIGAIILFDAVEYWAFGAQIGWVSVLACVVLSAAFTYLFFLYRRNNQL